MKNDKLKHISVYVTVEELEQIKDLAREYDVTTSYCLRSLLNQYSPLKLPPLHRGAPPGNTNASGRSWKAPARRQID